MLNASSESQFSAATRGELPAPEVLSDGIWSFSMPMGSQGLPYNLCYVIEDFAGDLHMIDPGIDSDANWTLLQQHMRGIGKSISDVQSIVATHLHPDHLGLAARIRAASGGSLALHRTEAHAALDLSAGSPNQPDPERGDVWGVPVAHRERLILPEFMTERAKYPAPDELIDDGDLLPVPGRELYVIHTPGHTSGHICVRDSSERILFTGDHVLPTVNSGIGLGATATSNQIDEYLNSLAAIAEFDDHEAAPGHEYRFQGLAERCHSIAAHQLQRTVEVRAALERSPHASTWEVASQLGWSAGWENLSGFVLISALSQTQMHVDFLRLGLAERHLRAHSQ